MKENGCLIISLDFELVWGGIGVWDETKYVDDNVVNAKTALSQMMDMFARFGIHPTLATVGMLMLKDKEDFHKMLPQSVPTYSNIHLSPYKDGFVNNFADNSLCFIPELIATLSKLDSIEIGSHTYSHYFCWEKGQTISQFDADLKQNIDIASRFGLKLNSLVFPRNEVSTEYLRIAKNNGFLSYRGNAKSFFNEPRCYLAKVKNRVGRLLDCYINISGHNSYKYENVEKCEGLWNLRASRFFRPYNIRLKHFESLKVKRICNEIEYAAKNGEIYHLWWHPHNFGANMKENLSELETVLKCFRECSNKYGMKSYTMSELVEVLNIENQ